MAGATPSCAGGRRASATAGQCRPAPAAATRPTARTWRASGWKRRAATPSGRIRRAWSAASRTRWWSDGFVFRVTEMLRKKGVVGKLVEFYGPGLAGLPLADRATIANMAPEYGATCGIFPVDQVALDYLHFTGRPAERIALVEAYMKEQG